MRAHLSPQICKTLSNNEDRSMPKKKLKKTNLNTSSKTKKKNKSFAQRFVQRLIENPHEDVYIDGKPVGEVNNSVFEE